MVGGSFIISLSFAPSPHDVVAAVCYRFLWISSFRLRARFLAFYIRCSYTFHVYFSVIACPEKCLV